MIAIVLAVAPIFVIGAVAVLLDSGIDLTRSRLGVCAAVFYGASAVAAFAGGRFADRVGGLRALGAGVTGSAVTLLGLATLTSDWVHVLAWMVLGGLANGVTQPATNLVVARAMPARSQGLAFGVKQTDGSLATLTAGLVATLIAVPFGWRWSVAAVALGAVAFFCVRPQDPPTAPRAAEAAAARPPAKRPLLLLGAGTGFATAAGVAMGSFYVGSVVSEGLSVSAAGWLLAGGSAAAAAARVGWGWVADRRGVSPYPLVSLLLLVGSSGFVLLALGGGTGVLILGTALAFGAGWGWPGLLLYGVVRENLEAPGEATGIVLTGSSIGGVAGPLVFGWLAENAGYATAWWGGAAAITLAAASVLAAHATRRNNGAFRPPPAPGRASSPAAPTRRGPRG